MDDTPVSAGIPPLMNRLRTSAVAFLSPIRLWDWWEFKVPVFLGVAYLAATAAGMGFDALWPRLLVVVAAIVPVASYVCVINDITDRSEDGRAGKPNSMLGRSPRYQAAWVAACLAGGGIALVGLRRSETAQWLYVANWLAFTLYSVPPIRLKSRGVWGVIADACGGQLLPTLWTAAFIAEGAEPGLSRGLWVAIGIWALALGCRGILCHQLRDLEADRAAGVGTLAARIGAEGTRRALHRAILPAEMVAFAIAAAYSGAWPTLVAFAVFFVTAWALQHFGVRSPKAIESGSFVVRYYITLFPLAGALQLAMHAPAALCLLPVHVAAFPGAWGLSLGRFASRFATQRASYSAAAGLPPPAGTISVVIPAFQGRRTIAACLESLSLQTGVDGLEVIVVESSGDGTADIVARDFPHVKLLREPLRLSAGAARNRGVSAATGGYILFLDQDCKAPTDWAARLVHHLRHTGSDAVGGSIGIANPWNLSGAAVYFIEFLHHFPGYTPPAHNPLFLLGCNAGYRADVLKTVQFPDRTLAEDVLFTSRVRAAGFKVAYAPGITVLHHNRTGWAEFFVYASKMGRAAADYHTTLDQPWVAPFMRWPILLFPASLAVSPLIALRLLRSRCSTFALFLIVAPACILGNLAWAAAFRRRVLEMRKAGDEQGGRWRRIPWRL